MQAPVKADESYQQGVKLLGQGKPEQAEEYFRVALHDRPDWAEAQNNLGVALANREKHAEAIQCFEKALALKPDYADAHHNFGNSLKRTGKIREAIDHFKEAIRLKPRWADVHNNLGAALRQGGSLDDALHHFRQALRIRPQHAEARNNLGVALTDRGMNAEAEPVYRQVLRDRPNSAETHSNLGVVLVHQGKEHEAISHYRKALELRPNYADARNNLGNALRHVGQLEEAEASLRQAIELRPEYAEAHNNLAIVLVKQERLEEAIAHYNRALQLKPEYADAHKNLGLALLGRARWEEGWREYEWRWTTKEMPARKFTQPRWDGSPLDGKSILLYSEQGLGDTIQFICYARLVQERGGRVIVECQKALLRLLGSCPGIFRLVGNGETLPEFHVQVPLMSLPGILCATPGKDAPAGPFPAGTQCQVPYFTADADRLRKWGEELKGITGFKIGIAWQGSTRYQDDMFRSVPLANFEPVARLPGVRLISLQKGFGVEQMAKVADWDIISFGKRLDEKGAFLDTAAILKHLDLMITSDSAIAHLAGAMGVPVWMAVGKAPDWRWLLEREDSPWYPTMRMFRQKKRGEWREVFERMARELAMRPPLENAARHEQEGMARGSEGKHAEAAAAFRRATELEPKNPALHNKLGLALEADGKKPEAIEAFREALRINPNDGDTLHNLGNVLRRTGRLPEAEEVYREALKVLPNSPEVCNHLGIALLGQAKHTEAEACFRRSLRLRGDHAEAHNNLGVLLEQLGHVEQATKCYQEALRIRPESADTHKNLALSWMMSGEFARGWPEYEWRWKTPNNPARFTSKPRWDGKPVQPGEAILLYAEQGLGDTIQFVRYAPLVKQRGAVVLVECPPVLHGLLSRCPGIDRIIPQGSPLPEFAYQIPFLSLPHALHTTMETVPAQMPYLSAEPSLIESWAKELDAMPGYKIGISWQGSKKYQGDAHRSVPLREFEPVLKIPGLRFISFQKGLGTEQLRDLPDSSNIVDFGDRLDANGAFLDTAAIMSNLDLMVTSDSAVAHLGGALGIPVWMAVSMAADWRWLRKGTDCPWYPTMRLYRQKRWGDWADVFQRIAADLQQYALPIRRPLPARMAPAELLDKITDLEIKRERTQDEKNLQHIHLELGALLATRARSLKSFAELDRLTALLKGVNKSLCEMNDEIRGQQQKGDFGERFVELARSVYRMNDERASIKRQINQLLGWRFAEEETSTSVIAHRCKADTPRAPASKKGAEKTQISPPLEGGLRGVFD